MAVTNNQDALTKLLAQNQTMMVTMQQQLTQSNERIAALTNELGQMKSAGGGKENQQPPTNYVPPPPGFENNGGQQQRNKSGDPKKDGHKCEVCLRMVYHSGKNCPAKPENKDRRRAGYKIPAHMLAQQG